MHRQRLVPASFSLSLIGTLLILSSSSVDAQTSVTGYLQAEWQHFDQRSNPDGRAFYSDARKNLFTIRRGRAKFTHQDSSYLGVLQADFTERGVEIKDAFLTLNVFDRNRLNVTVGLFNRPNFEVERSSSNRESPERSQVVRAFYPSERDLGVRLETTPRISENFAPKIQFAILNGTQQETDALKDIAARLIVPLPLGTDSKVKATIGASWYHGGIPQPNDSIVQFENGESVVVFEDADGSWAGWGNRSNIGLEAQLELDALPIGRTAFYTEFLMGTRPEAIVREFGDTAIPTVAVRDQMGYYVMLTQELGKKFMLAAKYDFFDRNTELTGDQVSSTRDRASTVFGFGLLGNFGPVRITAWYEIPTYGSNEARFLDGAGEEQSDDLKDNKTTVRFQYRFR